MLTTNEAAELLGVKPNSVRVWLSEEGHPRFPNAQKFGRDWQIPESDLDGQPRGRGRGRPKKAEGEGAASDLPAVTAAEMKAGDVVKTKTAKKTAVKKAKR